MKVEFPIVCPKCRHAQSVLFSQIKHRRNIPCACGFSVPLDRKTVRLIGKSLQAVHRTIAKLRGR